MGRASQIRNPAYPVHRDGQDRLTLKIRTGKPALRLGYAVGIDHLVEIGEAKVGYDALADLVFRFAQTFGYIGDFYLGFQKHVISPMRAWRRQS